MLKRGIGVTALLVVAVCLFTYWAYSAQTNNRTADSRTQVACPNCNVILISVDSLRADHMSAYGYTRNTTPYFDAFAKKSFLFTNYFSTSFLTPVSEMSVQTGLYPTANGVSNFDTVLPTDRITITEVLKKAGYHTTALISSPEFVGNTALKESFSRGFDEYIPFLEATTTPGRVSRDFPTKEEIRSFLENTKTEPSFLWLAIGGVHWPYGYNVKNVYADPEYNGVFKDKPLDWGTFQFFYKGLYYPDKKPVTEKDITYIRDLYDNDVQSFDGFLSELVTELQSRNMLKNTVIVIESEHGEDLGEHGYIAHYDVLDTQTHVPLLIYIPNTNGKRVESLASGVDITPTLMALLGVTPPTETQGGSLVPLMDGSGVPRSEVFLERNPLWEEAIRTVRLNLTERGFTIISGKYRDIAIRTERWKYILRLSRERMDQISWWAYLTKQPMPTPEAELYDLQNDPEETKNVIADYPEEAAALRAKLEAWYQKVLSEAPSSIQRESQIQPYF